MRQCGAACDTIVWIDRRHAGSRVGAGRHLPACGRPLINLSAARIRTWRT